MSETYLKYALLKGMMTRFESFSPLASELHNNKSME